MINYTYIRNFLQSMLSAHGFKRSGSAFYKNVGSIVQVVELQKHTFEVDGHKILSVLIAIIVPDLYRKAFKREPTLVAGEGIIDFYIDELMLNLKRKKVQVNTGQ